jgi:hypothetical protein
VSKAGTATFGARTESASESNVSVLFTGSGTTSLRTASAVSIVVTALGVGAKTGVRPTSVQQMGEAVELASRNARMTTTCIGPVSGPTRTAIRVTVPATGTRNVPCCGLATVPTLIQVHVGWPLGRMTTPLPKAFGTGSAVQSKATLAGRLRSAPNGIAGATDAARSDPDRAMTADAASARSGLRLHVMATRRLTRRPGRGDGHPYRAATRQK